MFDSSKVNRHSQIVFLGEKVYTPPGNRLLRRDMPSHEIVSTPLFASILPRLTVMQYMEPIEKKVYQERIE